ncbi:MAG: hypothetical protein ACOYWZ_00040 [Bacillota bacterium]
MADELQFIQDILNNNWNKNNTDNRKPIIDKIFNLKRADMSPNQDYVLLYLVSGSYTITPLGLGTNEKESLVISIDIRTMITRSHSLKIREEIMRILRENKILNPDLKKFNVIRMERINDLTDKSIGLYRQVLDLRCEDFRVVA